MLQASDQQANTPWVATAVNSGPSHCGGRLHGCVICTTPAAGVLMSAMFAIVYGAYLLRLRTEARRVVLNRVRVTRAVLGLVCPPSVSEGLRAVSSQTAYSDAKAVGDELTRPFRDAHRSPLHDGSSDSHVQLAIRNFLHRCTAVADTYAVTAGRGTQDARVWRRSAVEPTQYMQPHASNPLVCRCCWGG
jgi:hypothetical protein